MLKLQEKQCRKKKMLKSLPSEIKELQWQPLCTQPAPSQPYFNPITMASQVPVVHSADTVDLLFTGGETVQCTLENPTLPAPAQAHCLPQADPELRFGSHLSEVRSFWNFRL